MSSTNILKQFSDRKKAMSPFISLADGDTLKVVRLKEIKEVTKSGFNGQDTNVLKLVCDVETIEGIREKVFENGSLKFANELIEKGVDIGSAFTITRNGVQAKTTYNISNVINPEM